MASAGPSKILGDYSTDKCISSGASNMSLDESNTSIPANNINMNQDDAYINSPSPSSTATTSTIDSPFKYRSSRFRDSYRPPLTSKRRYRYDKLFHLTHSLNRQYVVAMTNVLFQMQKEIYKLKRRAYHVEHILAKQKASDHPIIRIPRLTKDEISTICVKDNENQQTNVSKISEENENKTDSQRTTIKNIKPLNEYTTHTESSITIDDKHRTDDNRIHRRKQLNPKNKYCSRCQHEFSHRSAYLRHMKKIHQGKFQIISSNNCIAENDNNHNETNSLISDQSIAFSETENGTDHDTLQLLVNQWDIGEGRLRPRPSSKLNHEPINKIKCDICHKFFRAEYIRKHKRRTHHVTQSFSSSELNDDCNKTKFSANQPMDDIQLITSESSTNNTNPSSTITVAEMESYEIPILFPVRSIDGNKPIVISITCLERYQLDIVDEFLKKFPSRVSQTTLINSQTTHVITNDDQHELRSPLSMKFIEAIANHCFCVSYRWVMDCLKYDRIVDESPYEIEGDGTDHHPHGGPKRSRLVEKRHSLFENICFMIKCTEDHEIKMTNDRLKELITMCGGQIITCVTQSLLDQYEIVVLCDKLYVSERRHNYDQCRSLGIHFVSSDWVLESILEYRPKLFSLYEETPL
ncbi:unnamed protein product [Rotaria socialis]|uniref:Uncharacterized protein n=1 Tax=Rotaria socialis TaxID=392032 RepID=A0A819V249_9BILA|nr:unnamed protein product [Rotaria socialis]